MIPMARPYMGTEEKKAVLKVMDTGNLASGEFVTEFEGLFADYCGSKYAVAVNSGTAALHAALMSSGIKKGDEVIVPAFSFIATATSVSMLGAKPVFVDVDRDNFTLDPEKISENITPKTKAIIGVHLFGHPFDVDSVSEICEDKSLKLIEDCAQAHGAEFSYKKAGTFGIAGCFSFYPTKNMTTGEGGIVITDRAEIADKVRRISNHGQSKKYLHNELGYNYRMTNISASIGIIQLNRLDLMNKKRCDNAGYYGNHLNCGGMILPACGKKSKHVYHQYVIRILDNFPLARDELMLYLKNKGIDSAVHYPVPIHRQPLYERTNVRCKCPVSEELSQSVLSLPVHPGVSIKDCSYICDSIREVV